MLPGYQNSGMQWQLRKRDEKSTTESVEINLVEGLKCSWTELGFPHLDSDDNDEEIKIPKGLKVMLTFSGMAPFDVTRGLW